MRIEQDTNFDLNCEWCLASDHKEVCAFASLQINGGLAGWSLVCRNCLTASISHEIENIRTDAYVGAKEKAWLIPIEIDVIKSIAFEGLE